MQRIVTTIEINRPVEEVYGFLAEPRNFPKWSWTPNASASSAVCARRIKRYSPATAWKSTAR
jgi:uncharacterized protein YndB with AHSA1/START domain